MRVSGRVESAHRRIEKPTVNWKNNDKGDAVIQKTDGPVPMELKIFELQKLTQVERELCRKARRCFHHCQKGNLANRCPKGREN